MKIRFATENDTPALLKIYSQYIDTPITFECSLPTEQEFSQRIADISASYPYLVCEENGRITGYAYAHRLQEREAYQCNSELTVYLDETCTSRGLGKKLYSMLIDILRLQGSKSVYGIVTLPNEKSERLHESFGFRRLYVCQNAGYKCGRWHDVVWFEKQIAPYLSNPAPIKPIGDIPYASIEEIIQKYI